MIKDNIVKILEEVTGEKNVNLTFPNRPEHGDYTTNIAMQKGGNPRKNAEEIKHKLEENTQFMGLVERVDIAGPGFINFFLNPIVIQDQIVKILSSNDLTSTSSENTGKRFLVEYSSPNIAKPFTIGHLRSTIIGDAVSNLIETTGGVVYRDNHLGDWGTQFGKQIFAIKEWGDEDLIAKSESPVKELVKLYVRFHEEAEKNPELEDLARAWFKKLEENDPEAVTLWKKCIDWSWKEFSKIYEDLGVKFTENNGKGYGESFFSDMMPTVIDELVKKDLLKEGEHGARLVFFGEDKYPPLMILKKDGTSLYATRDLAADKFRLKEYGKDVVIINEVGAEQSLYFKQLYELEHILGWVKEGQRIHIKHGLFRFKDKKMSTRKGNVIWLQDVLNEAYKHAKKIGSNEENYKEVAIGALKWNELKRDPTSDIIFDWDEILNMKGNSGPYMQYTVVRAEGILKKADKEVINNVFEFGEEEHELARMLVKFPEIVSISAENYSTSTLCTYLFELAQAFNSYYDKVKIVGTNEESMRLSLVKAVNLTLTEGLHLLGITVPSKM